MKDYNRKKRKTNYSFLILCLIGVFLGAGIGIAAGYFFPGLFDVDFGELILYLLLLVFCLIIFWLVQNILHELGHLVFGLLTGYKFSLFRVSSFVWVKTDGKIKLKRMSLAGTSGQCLLSPPDMTDGKMPYVLYNIGGALMNLIFSLIAVCLIFVFSNYLYVSIALILFALVGIICALCNGLPMRTNMIDNDGMNLLSISRTHSGIRSFWIQLKVNEMSVAGKRIKDMPQEWFEIPARSELVSSINTAIAVLYENRLMDMHRFEEAALFIDELLLSDDINVPGLYSAMIICDSAYCELVADKENPDIGYLFDSRQLAFMKNMASAPSVLRTQYAVALLYENDMEKAQRLKGKFEKCANTYPSVGEIVSENELIKIADEIYFSKINNSEVTKNA